MISFLSALFTLLHSERAGWEEGSRARALAKTAGEESHLYVAINRIDSTAMKNSYYNKMAKKRLNKKTRLLMPTQTLHAGARRGGPPKVRLRGKQGGGMKLQCNCKKK